MKLTVIIVNYNVQHFLEQCLHSVFAASKNITTEIFVVDNNSVDGSVQMVKEKFQEVHLIENKKNTGFSYANNQAIRIAKGEYILLLNPDTVVEVGVDVPNASMMVIMDAERFGVSQLHQLRGRVGRGSVPGLCLLVTSADEGTQTMERLNAVAATLDGFELARIDLEQRKEGDVLGSSQSGGKSHLRLLRVLRDEDLIEKARTDALALLEVDATLKNQPQLLAEVNKLKEQESSAFMDKS